MKSKTFFFLLFSCVLLALILSSLAVLFLNRSVQMSNSSHRDRFIGFISQSLQEKIRPLEILDIRSSPELFDRPFGGGFPPPPPMPPPGEMPRMMPPPPPLGGPGGPGGPRGPRPLPQIWLVNLEGEVLNSTTDEALPLNWKRLKKPTQEGELESIEDYFRLNPGVYVTQLKAKNTPVFFVLRDNPRSFFGFLFATQALLSLGTVIIALGLAFALTFFYLRRKSLEARAVLLKLEMGDLKTRFEIKGFDEFGGLLLDFNRMADEIEKLVNRIYQVEATRKNLLQELGHDVRTPLTSIKTSFDTLKQYRTQMTAEDQNSTIDLIQGEIDYLNELFDKLMTVALLDEPHYKKNTELISVKSLLQEETLNRKNVKLQLPQEDVFLLGDSHLISRLIRNALDNAVRFAKSQVEVNLTANAQHLQIRIEDDGPGFDENSLKTFGTRREFSGRSLKTGQHISSGLGSVIMKAIAELHQGQILIQNKSSGSGASVVIQLPMSSRPAL